MTEHNTPWLLRVKTASPWGLCEENLPEVTTEEYVPFAVCDYPDSNSGTLSQYRFEFRWYGGEIGQESNGRNFTAGQLIYRIYLEESIRRWAQRTYDLPSDLGGNDRSIEVTLDLRVSYGNTRTVNRVHYGVATTAVEQRFETEAEAIEFAESQSVVPLITFIDGDYLFRVRFTQVIEGVTVDRNVGIQHTGDPLKIYTIADLENYYANALGDDTPFRVEAFPDNWQDYWTGADCEPRLEATILNLDDFGSSTITIEPDIQSIPGRSSITIVDGDPDLTLTEVVNGPGSITISDNGNINMSNDGGSFYLNEFGHSGMYANGDVSLTAGQTAQLGVGSHSLSVVSDGFIFQRGGEMLKVSFDRMKEVFGE